MADSKPEPKKELPKEVVDEKPSVDPAKGEVQKKDPKIEEKKIEPPKATSLTIKQNGKATAFARKFTKPEEAKPESKGPKFVNDLFQRININSNIHLDSGPENITIDCQPDYRNLFLALTYYCTKIYQDINIKDNALITPPSLMAYFLSLIYGHALISETSNVRNMRSAMANEFTAEDTRRDLLNVLENLPTPPFIKDLLTSLMPTCDPRRPGIQFVHSLACFLMRHDYGRAYPITAFLKAHSLIASHQANIAPEVILNQFYNTSLLTHNNAAVLHVRNIFGARLPNGTYPSTIVNAVETLFNPVTQRTNSMRPTFSRLVTFPYEHELNNNVNPYIYLLGADENNVATVTGFLTSMGANLKQELKCSDVLGSCFSISPGIGLLVHYYSNMSFPTWHSSNVEGSAVSITATNHANQVGFMTVRQDNPDRVNVPYPPPGERNNFADGIYLRNVTAGPYNPVNDPDTVNTFSVKEHITPDVLYFNPWDYVPTEFASNVTNGLHIESSGITSTIVPQPHARTGLYNNNSQFLNACIPAHLIVEAYDAVVNRPFVDYQVNIGTSDNQCVRLSTTSIHQNRLPSYTAELAEPAATVPSVTGFHVIPGIGSIHRSSNTIAFQHGTIDQAETTTSWSNRPIHLWSSYRYFNLKLSSTSDREHRISLFINMRSNYGTNVTLAETRHPFALIPTS